MARVWFENDVGVGRLSVNLCRKRTILMAVDKNVQKCDFPVYFIFSCKLNPRMDFVEALIKCLGGICQVAVAAKTRAKVLARCDGPPAVIHVNMKIVRVGGTSLLSELDRGLNRVDHPHLRHGYHQGKTDRSRVVRGVVPLVECEVCCVEAEGKEHGYVVGSKFCSLMKACV